jgi:hypothetical protein
MRQHHCIRWGGALSGIVNETSPVIYLWALEQSGDQMIFLII